MRCPECGKDTLIEIVRDEDFEFNGVWVHAENVPAEMCESCGLEMTGPDAAEVREAAIRKAGGLPDA